MSLSKTLSNTSGSILVRGLYTGICLHFEEARINHRLRFGVADYQVHLDKERSVVFFPADQTLGYIRWRANDYGTQDWQFCVARTVSAKPDEDTDITAFPGILPGADILLHVSGKTKVKRVLALLDGLEERHADLSQITESWWRQLHNRLEVRAGFHRPDDYQLAGGQVKPSGSDIVEMDIWVP